MYSTNYTSIKYHSGIILLRNYLLWLCKLPQVFEAEEKVLVASYTMGDEIESLLIKFEDSNQIRKQLLVYICMNEL